MLAQLFRCRLGGEGWSWMRKKKIRSQHHLTEVLLPLELASEKGILTQHEQRPEVRGLFAQSADGILEVETQRSRQCGCGWIGEQVESFSLSALHLTLLLPRAPQGSSKSLAETLGLSVKISSYGGREECSRRERCLACVRPLIPSCCYISTP